MLVFDINNNISQSSVTTRVSFSRVFNDNFVANFLLSETERILKIGQHLTNL